jgi:hypothetical protein
VAGQPYAAPG